jgi:peptidyl-prolyl cis-trans isomerase D
VTAAFSGPVGATASTPGADGESRILLQVTAVDADALPDALNNDDQQLTAMAQAAGDDILDQMVNRLQSDYGVTINQAAADQAMVGF